MVAKPGVYQASNNAGELKPELHGRTDLKQWYAGMAYMRNIEPVPQGGSRLMPRTRFMGRVRRLLESITPISTSFSYGPHVMPGIVAIMTFNSAPGVSVVSFPNFSSNIGGLVAGLQIEWFDGADWHNFSFPFNVDNRAVTRTVTLPPGAQVHARALRLNLTLAPTAPCTFTIGGMIASSETAALPTAKLRPFTFDLEQTYVSVLTDGQADYYRAGTFVGGASTGFTGDRLSVVSTQQRLDTMFLFHESIAPQRILRNGADNEWIRDNIPFTSIPRVDLGGSYNNQVTDIWYIYLSYPTDGTYANGAGVYLSLNISGEETNAVQTGTPPDWGSLATQLKAAIEALPSIGPGIDVGVPSVQDTYAIITVAFAGADNNGNRNTMSAQVVNTTAAAATVTHAQLGVPGGEPIMSGTAGYPACAGFYQERLFTGGFRSKRGAFLASVTGDYFNLNTEVIAITGAILNNLDTDGAERLHAIVRGRYLVLFTTDAEYFISDRVISRGPPLTIVNSSRNGSAPGVPILESEGSLLYVTRNRNLLMAATYDDVSQAYNSAPISLLASHIASDITGMSLQKSAVATDAARLWQPRDDGTMCVGIMLRNQDVTAFVRWETDGLVKDACVDGGNVPYILVERTVGGIQELHFERIEQGLLFDGTVEQTFDTPRTVITGLSMHEGATVWADADGYIVGPFTVTNASITLRDPASHVLVGRWTPPRGVPLPLASEVAEGVVLKRPKRVHTVHLDLVDTTSVALGANGLPARDVGLYRAGDPVDQPLAGVTDEIIVTGLRGFSPGGQIEITQTKPGRLAWSGFTREARK